jgi:hypothetical protein
MSDTKFPFENGAGTRWRILSSSDSKPVEIENRGVFDELVLDDWLHIEHMEGRQWWLRVGDARLWVSIDEAGKPQVDIERGYYAAVNGETKTIE